MRLLDLFSGTHSVANAAKELGYEVTTLDLADSDINCDILDWDYTIYPRKHWDVIFASPPCNTFSCAKRSNIGRYGITQMTIDQDIEKLGLPLLRKTEEIINYFEPTYYFIENPQTGRMKEYVDKPFYDVDYCRYCDWGYKKRTRIFTNKTDFTPKLCLKSNVCENMVGTRHKKRATGGTKTQGGQADINLRYRIPNQLIHELFQNC